MSAQLLDGNALSKKMKAKIKEAPPPKVLKKRRKSKTVEKVAAPIHIVIKSAPDIF